jgi:S1-C subfamily serine protease
MSTQTLIDFSNDLAGAVAAIAPSVVQVHGRRRPVSGVAYAADLVLTTARALGREDAARVRTADGQTAAAELGGWDPATGLAILRTTGLALTPASIADAEARVGHLAIAVGRSWSNAATASFGMVAVIGGPLPTWRGGRIEQVIRTTAPMHDGFAGGAFAGVDGRLLGINTSMAIRGLTVVIPAAIAWKTAATLAEFGSPRRGYLGVAGQPVSIPERQRAAANLDQATGLLIAGVSADSPAERAGVLLGDVLLSVDGQPIASPVDLLDLLKGSRADRAATLRVFRGGVLRDLTVEIGQR